MAEEPKSPPPEAEAATEAARRVLPEAAKRALAEAEERRRMRDAAAQVAEKKEVGGRNGPDPVRYGDWEKDGIISDF